MGIKINSSQCRELLKEHGFMVPEYDREEMIKNTEKSPCWIHFGSGNIFRAFIAVAADDLISSGLMNCGIIAAESYDFEIIDRVYKPFDNRFISVTLNADSAADYRLVDSVAFALKADRKSPDFEKLRGFFCEDSLRMVSLTVTEKAYSTSGIEDEISGGPEKAVSLMPMLALLLYERYVKSGAPLTLVSMDNCSHNGEKLQNGVMAVAEKWAELGFVPAGFIDYLREKVSFPWTMIDKITPRPSEKVSSSLSEMGIEGMSPIITSKNTYIAPFVNAEKTQYLVVEDDFANGRPLLEKAGIYFTDRKTVNKTETMKVTTCLNPLHTALAVFGCILGYTSISDAVSDPDLKRLITVLGYDEGMPVVTSPGIISPEKFIDEVVNERLPNPYIPDTPQRIATDTSKKMSVRYGETIKSYNRKYGSAERLNAIPLIIAGWLRYLLALDDNMKEMTLSPDPELERLQRELEALRPGVPESVGDDILELLRDESIFGCDLVKSGLSDKIIMNLKQMLAGPGAVRKTLSSFMC